MLQKVQNCYININFSCICFSSFFICLRSTQNSFFLVESLLFIFPFSFFAQPCPTISISVHSSICLSIHLSIRLCLHPSIPFVRPSIRPSVHLFVQPSVQPSVLLSVCLLRTISQISETVHHVIIISGKNDV